MAVMVVSEESTSEDGGVRSSDILQCNASWMQMVSHLLFVKPGGCILYRFLMLRKSFLIVDEIADLCSVDGKYFALLPGGWTPTAAVSEERLKNEASNKPTSSLKKWPPCTFVCVTMRQIFFPYVDFVA